MASYTPNYNLKKPADSDSYDISDANGNMDIIDGALNTLNNHALQIVTVRCQISAQGYYKWNKTANEVAVVSVFSTDRLIRPFVGSDGYWYFTATGWNNPGNNDTSGDYNINIIYYNR